MLEQVALPLPVSLLGMPHTTSWTSTLSWMHKFLSSTPWPDSAGIAVIAAILVVCHIAILVQVFRFLKGRRNSGLVGLQQRHSEGHPTNLLELSDGLRGCSNNDSCNSSPITVHTANSNSNSNSNSNDNSNHFGMGNSPPTRDEVLTCSFEDNSLGEILRALKLPEDLFSAGLSATDAQQRLGVYGPNALDVPSGRSCWQLFVAALFGFTNSLLLLVALLAFSNGSHPDAEIFLAVVLFASTLSAFGERRAAKAAAELQEQQSKTATCLRNASWTNIAVEELVPGDVVRLETGHRVPADVRVLESTELLVNEVVLTGEPIDRPKGTEVAANQPVGEPRNNMLYASTDVTGGHARGLVVYTGMKTRIGSLVLHLQEAGSKNAEASSVLGEPLQRAIDGLARQLVFLCLLTFVLCMDVCIFTQYKDPGSKCEQQHDAQTCLWINSMYLSLLTCMRVIPQMLIPVCLLCLNTAVSRIRQVGGSVRKPGSIEAIGACSIVCTDKTGTLTEGRMSCTSLFTCLPKATCVELDMGQPVGTLLQEGQVEPEMKEELCRILLGLSTLNCHETTRLERVPVQRRESLRSRLSDFGEALVRPRRRTSSASSGSSTSVPEACQTKVFGNATEVPIVRGALQGGLEPEHLWQEYPAELDVPFTSSRKVRASIHRRAGIFTTFEACLKEAMPGASHFAILKGAPDRLLPHLTGLLNLGLSKGEAEALPAEELQALVQSQNASWAARALRVLLVAMVPLMEDEVLRLRSLDADSCLQELLARGLSLLCSIALWDPPRQGVAEAALQCREAGIRVVMITGDQAPTAAAIAELINIRGQASLTSVLHESSGELLPLSELERHALSTDVWARAQPEDKIALVSTLKGLNNTVAMTGDGVNDSPALVEADVGVAMGSGSSVAQQAAAVVLVDDNFTSIVKCIEEGRRAFANISKIVTYWLSINIAELLLNTSIFVLCIPTPFSGANQQLLGLLTTTLGVLPLTCEPAEASVMLEQPRPRNGPLIPPKVWQHLILPMWMIYLVLVLTTLHFGLLYHVGASNNQSLDRLCSFAFHWNPGTETFRKDEAPYHCNCPALGIEQWGRRQTPDNNLANQFEQTTGSTGSAYEHDPSIWNNSPLQACPSGATDEFGKPLPDGAICWAKSWLDEEACISSDGQPSSSLMCHAFENLLLERDCADYGTLLAKTMAWHVMALCELAFLHCVRSPRSLLSTFSRNTYSICLLALSLGLAEAGMMLPHVNEALNLAPLGFVPFCATLVCPLIMIVLIESSKKLAR